MSRHEGVSCDNCLKSNFEGKRFKCLICYDYDLCESCHVFEINTSRHSSTHPMQCILTRNEFELYYGGENISPESPPSFVCPFCAKLGFTEALLHEHVNKEHADAHSEVVCPICAALPSGDPNLVTDELATHLSMEHRAPRDAEDQAGGRHIRRMFYPGRGMRSRNHRNMHFSSGPTATSAIPTPAVANNNVASSVISAGRDSMDPIAELLSQLSGVRRSAQQLQQTVTTSSQLQELQSQLQMERQRAAELRQQLERFPGKSNPSTNPGVHVQPSGGVNNSSKSAAKRPNSNVHSDEDDDSRYLLSNLDELNLSSKEKEQQSNEDSQRSLFVQELLLSIFSEGAESHLDQAGSPPLHMQRAMPTECPLLASTPNNTTSSGRPLESSCEVSDDRGSWKRDGNKSSSNNKEDTGVGHSMSSGNAQSPLAPSLSEACESPQFADVQPTGSRSAPVLTPDSSDRVSSDPERWIYREDDDSKDSDEDKPPSPTPMLGMRIPGRMFGAGTRPVRVAGGVGGAAVNDFNRDEVSSSTLTKHIR
ncbi:E3 ubiquitin-protein ligase KCMF1 isoform X2 [Ciona intestinalis]